MSQCAFVFPGQGSQKVGAGADLFEQFPPVRELFDAGSALLGRDLAEICFHGPEETLTDTRNAQPALLTLGVACAQLLQERGFQPDVVAGHSLGEYAALVVSGALEFEAAVSLVDERARLMASAADGAMAAIIGLDAETVADACRQSAEVGPVQPANFNCPGQVVISGAPAAVEKVGQLAIERGARRCVPLPVSGAFHSSLMAEAGRSLAQRLRAHPFTDARIPVVSNTTAQPESDGERLREALIPQMTSPVRWEESVQRMRKDGVETFIETGPGTVLCGLVRRIDRDCRTLHVGDLPSLEKTCAALADRPAD